MSIQEWKEVIAEAEKQFGKPIEKLSWKDVEPLILAKLK